MEARPPTLYELRKIRMIADYQLGRGAGEALFPSQGLTIAHSRSTGRIRHIYLDGKLIATLRPRDGMLALTIHGGEQLLRRASLDELPVVVVRSDVARFVGEGRSLFCRHVVRASPMIRPGDEVIVLDEDRRLIALGRAFLGADEMRTSKTGIAVKTRWGLRKPLEEA
ncbi:pseudouridine synthase [Candidatus Bathyarchaeota archaeon]|nr:pseudouridine synthase [Candidatus Bathyarchaeota archaeon]